MKYLLFAYFILLSKQTISQQPIESNIRKLIGFYIGDSIKKVKELVICADGSYLDLSYNDNSNCQAYRYIPAQIDSIEITSIKFGDLFFHVTSSKTIKTIGLHKSYFNTKSFSKIKEANEAFNSVTTFFTNLFQLSEEINTYKNENFRQNRHEWKKNNLIVVLNKTNFKKNKDGKKLTTLSIDIYIE